MAQSETPIEHTLTLFLAVITGSALLIISTAFLSYEWVALRREMVRNLDAQAQILANVGSTEADLGVDLGDNHQAEKTLSTLQANKQIQMACIFNKEGVLLATYPGGIPAASLPKIPQKGNASFFRSNSLELFHTIVRGDRVLGTIFISSDLDYIHARFTFTVKALAGIAIIVFGLVIIAARHLQKRISEPILEQIQSRDAQLLNYQNHLEDQVDQRSDQLLRANTQLLLAKESAEEASRAKSAFLANMSHELRTPLNAILLYSELLADEMHERGLGELVGDLGKIQGAGKHLLSLIDDILDLSKIEAGRMTVYLEDCDIPSLLEGIATTIEPLVAKNRNRLVVEADPSIQVIHTDIKKLRQTLYNLLNNASKFTQDGTITLGVRIDPKDDHYVSFTVADTGIGMSPEQASRIFLEFTQADESTTRKFGGTGLGLTLCRKFLDLLGGEVSVTSTLGEGSTFEVRLPRISTSASSTVLRAKSAPSTSLRWGKVLVIDDDPALRDAVSRMLTKEGFWVAVASNGIDGLKMARSLHPQIITLDISMPGIDGWQVLSQLKADPELQHIPVIVITVMNDQAKSYELGAAEFLHKPISKEQLLETIRRVLPNDNELPILIAEDDESTLEGLQRLLVSEGMEVRGAHDGREALELIQVAKPGLILLDLMMPGMDGFQLMEELQEHLEWQHIPVVVLTAKDLTTEDLERLRTSQVQQVLHKGACSRDELVEAIHKFALRIIDEQKNSPNER